MFFFAWFLFFFFLMKCLLLIWTVLSLISFVRENMFFFVFHLTLFVQETIMCGRDFNMIKRYEQFMFFFFVEFTIQNKRFVLFASFPLEAENVDISSNDFFSSFSFDIFWYFFFCLMRQDFFFLYFDTKNDYCLKSQAHEKLFFLNFFANRERMIKLDSINHWHRSELWT